MFAIIGALFFLLYYFWIPIVVIGIILGIIMSCSGDRNGRYRS